MEKNEISAALRKAYDYVMARPAVLAAISIGLIILGAALV